jgi:hypothetical protein
VTVVGTVTGRTVTGGIVTGGAVVGRVTGGTVTAGTVTAGRVTGGTVTGGTVTGGSTGTATGGSVTEVAPLIAWARACAPPETTRARAVQARTAEAHASGARTERRVVTSRHQPARELVPIARS